VIKSDQEKKMLKLLGLVILIGLAYYFGYMPLKENVDTTREEVEQKEAEYKDGLDRYARSDKTQDQINDYNQKIYAFSTKYFSEEHQEEYLLRVNRLAAISGVNFKNITYGRSSALDAQQNSQGDSGSVFTETYMINYTADFNQLKRLLLLFEKTPEFITSNRLTISYKHESGSLVPFFHAVMDDIPDNPVEAGVLDEIRRIPHIDRVNLMEFEEKIAKITEGAARGTRNLTSFNVEGELMLTFYYMKKPSSPPTTSGALINGLAPPAAKYDPFIMVFP